MIFFDELLEAQDFRAAVEEIGRDFRARFALPPIHQLGLVVPDVEKAADELEAKGLGPFFIVDGSVDIWKERGEDKSFAGKMGLAHYQGYEIELLEPGNGSDFYRQCLDSGRPVVQHMGFLVNDVDIWSSVLSQAGCPVWVKGDMGVWPVRTRFTYMDTVKESGLIMEFICWSILGMVFEPPSLLYRGLAHLEKRLGIRSISM